MLLPKLHEPIGRALHQPEPLPELAARLPGRATHHTGVKVWEIFLRFFCNACILSLLHLVYFQNFFAIMKHGLNRCRHDIMDDAAACCRWDKLSGFFEANCRPGTQSQCGLFVRRIVDWKWKPSPRGRFCQGRRLEVDWSFRGRNERRGVGRHAWPALLLGFVLVYGKKLDCRCRADVVLLGYNGRSCMGWKKTIYRVHLVVVTNLWEIQRKSKGKILLSQKTLIRPKENSKEISRKSAGKL